MMRSRTNRGQNVKSKYFAYAGGLNLVDPPLDTPPGMVLGAQNYECRVRGGYRRIAGHERFDGHESPSDANYWTLPFDAGTTEPAVGQIVVGQTSLARGRILEVVVDSGAFATNDAVGTFVIYRVSGLFVNDEVIVNGHSAFSIGFDSGFE